MSILHLVYHLALNKPSSSLYSVSAREYVVRYVDEASAPRAPITHVGVTEWGSIPVVCSSGLASHQRLTTCETKPPPRAETRPRGRPKLPRVLPRCNQTKGSEHFRSLGKIIAAGNHFLQPHYAGQAEKENLGARSSPCVRIKPSLIPGETAV